MNQHTHEPAESNDEDKPFEPIVVTGPGSAGHIHLTERDHQMLLFLLRFRAATAAQLDRRFAFPSRSGYRRRALLRDAGLIRSIACGPRGFGAWMITTSGANYVQTTLDLPVPRNLAWGTLAKTLTVTELGVVLELRGEEVMTSTEMMAHDGVTRRGWARSRLLHIPDLAISTPYGPSAAAAVEVVMTPMREKKRVELVRIYARAIKGDGKIGSLVFYSPLESELTKLHNLALKYGIDVRVQTFLWDLPAELGTVGRLVRRSDDLSAEQ